MTMLPQLLRITSLVVVLLCLQASALLVHHNKLIQDKSVSSAYPVHWKETRLDHFDPLNTKTFRQRYWINYDNWNKTSGPVLLYINGEGPVGGPPASPDDEVVLLAKQLGALIVTEEHRYYGETQPFDTMTTEHLQYLSSRQALNDLADFIAHIRKTVLNGSDRKWFTIGGSYSGALSAWFRLKFPHLTTGSIASSGVVNAILDFTAFDEQVATSVGPVCADVLRQVTSALEKNILHSGPTQKLNTLRMFDAESLTNDGDFFYFAGDVMATSVQYGFQDNLCTPLLTAKGNDSALVQAFALLFKTFWSPVFGSAEQYSTAYQSSTKVAPERNYRPWWFQKCTEFAWFQTAPAKNPIRSRLVDLAYHRRHCKDLFGQDLWPNVNETNEYYGGANIQATNVVFVDGSQDPWQHASVLQSLSSSEPALVITCHNCGHCVDLGGCPGGCQPPVALTSARKIISQLVTQWISQ